MPKGDFTQDLKAFGGLPLFIVAIIIAFFLKQKLALHLFIILILCYAVTSFIRIIYFKQRPKKEKHTNWWQKIDASSFPSLHSMRAAALATVLALFFNNIILTVIFAISAIIVAVLRVNQKKHYTLDVIVGFILGIIIALLTVRFI